MAKKRGNKSRSSDDKGRRGGDGSSFHLPAFVPSVTIRRKVRWQSVAGSNALGIAITYRMLGDIWNVGDTGGTVGYQLFNFLRVIAVDIWQPALATGLAATCSVEYASAATPEPDKSSLKSDTVLGTAGFAHVHLAPSTFGYAKMWTSSTSSAQVFNMIHGPGAVIQLTYEGTIRDGYFGASALANAVVGVTGGNFYQRSIDGIQTAGANYLSISAPQD